MHMHQLENPNREPDPEMSPTAPANGEDSALTEEDLEVIAGAQRALDSGVELKKWWEKVDRADREGQDAYEGKFEEASVHRRPEDHSFGFFETAELAGGKTKVIGNVQEQLFHRPKAGTPELVQNQIREFVLRYFMRVSVYRTPQPHPEQSEALGPLVRFSRHPTADDYKLQGFGYSQRYFKRNDEGEVRKFKEAEQNVMLDLRKVREDYEWTIIRNPIVDFAMNIRPLGVRGPELKLPIPTATNWVVMSPDTITIDENPGMGLLGRYGIGYAFMKEPGEPGMFAYGPGQLEPTVQTLVWEVHENGDVIVRMSFVSTAPKGLLNFSMNPLDWGFMATELLTAGQFSSYLAPFRRAVKSLPFSKLTFDPVFPAVNAMNVMTLGAAKRQLGISQDDMNKTLTYAHFLQHYNAVLGSRQTWEMFSDWTDKTKLPEWVRKGDSA